MARSRGGALRWLAWARRRRCCVVVVAINAWFAAHILWWRTHPVGETSFMAYRMDELRAKNPKAVLHTRGCRTSGSRPT